MYYSDSDPERKYDLTFGLSKYLVNSDDDSEMDDSSEEEEDSEMYDSEEEDSEMYDSEEEDSDDSSEEKEVRLKKMRKRKEVRNWLELPPDVMSQIFFKLDTIDILFRVQSVCSAWRKLAKEPQLYRSIDMQNQCDLFIDGEYDMEKMAKEAVDRSCGQLVDFAVGHFATDELLQYITDKRIPLRRLRLVSCYQVYDEALIEAAKKLPLLEEVEICHHSFSEEVLDAIGHSCPLLKYFRLNCMGYNGPDRFECDEEAHSSPDRFGYDEEAHSIARSMPGLHHLHLFGNSLTDNGLRAILDGCPHLKSLDLRQCFDLNFGGDLKKRCEDRNIEIKLPNDSTIGYEFDTNCTGDDPESQDSPPDSYFWFDNLDW